MMILESLLFNLYVCCPFLVSEYRLLPVCFCFDYVAASNVLMHRPVKFRATV